MEEYEKIIQPISEINGNIEITFNKKNRNLDPYEPILEQFVLTLGKTGRANRLTFNQLDSKSIYQAAESLTDIAKQLEQLEQKRDEDLNEDDFSLDDLRTEVGEAVDDIKSLLNEKGATKTELIFSELGNEHDRENLEEGIQKLKRNGSLFEPEENVVQRI